MAQYRNRFTGRFMSKAAVDAIQNSVHGSQYGRNTGMFGLSVPLTLDAAGFHSGIAQAKAALNSFSSFTNNVLGSLTGVFRKLVGLVNPLTAALGVAGLAGSVMALASSFNTLDRSMTRSLAIMGNVSNKMKNDMRTAAIEVSKTTMFTASQAADAYFYLASAGLNAEQSLKSMPIVANFAQAGYFDLATATNMLADSQSALGMRTGDAMQDMKNMTRISDVLTKANIMANAEVEDFAAALVNNAAGALRLVNKDVEEGVAVLAAYADQGIKGEEAGTALGIVMRDLQTKAIKHADAFKKNGVEVYNATGKMNNMADIIEDLEQRLNGLSDSAKKNTLMQMGFADRSVAFLQTLIGTSDRIREYEKSLRDAGGATSDLASKIQTDLDKALNQLKGSLQQVAENFAPVIKYMAEFIDGFTRISLERDKDGNIISYNSYVGDANTYKTDALAPQDEWAAFAQTAHSEKEINAFNIQRMLRGDFQGSDAYARMMDANAAAMAEADAAKQGNFLNRGIGAVLDYQKQAAWGIRNPFQNIRDRLSANDTSEYNAAVAKREAEAKVKAENEAIGKMGKNFAMNNTMIGQIMQSAGLTSFSAIQDKARLAMDQVKWAPSMAMGAARRFMDEQGLKPVQEGGMGQAMFTSAQDPLSREGFAQRVRSSGQEDRLATQQLAVAKQSEKHLSNIATKMTGESIILIPASMA